MTSAGGRSSEFPLAGERRCSSDVLTPRSGSPFLPRKQSPPVPHKLLPPLKIDVHIDSSDIERSSSAISHATWAASALHKRSQCPLDFPFLLLQGLLARRCWRRYLLLPAINGENGQDHQRHGSCPQHGLQSSIGSSCVDC